MGLMIDENFLYLGIFLGFVGNAIYLLEVLKGTTKPNRVSFTIWALAPTITFFAQLDEGVGKQSLYTLSSSLSIFAILLASFINKNAYWELKKSDYIYGLLALFGLVLWQVTDKPALAIIFALSADALAAIPTGIKSYKFPKSESFMGFSLPALGAAITLLSIENFVFEEYIYPLYIALVASLFALFIKTEIGETESKSSF